jgi:hypothetical protein
MWLHSEGKSTAREHQDTKLGHCCFQVQQHCKGTPLWLELLLYCCRDLNAQQAQLIQQNTTLLVTSTTRIVYRLFVCQLFR